MMFGAAPAVRITAVATASLLLASTAAFAPLGGSGVSHRRRSAPATSGLRMSDDGNNPFAKFFQKKTEPVVTAPSIPDVVIDPDFRLAIFFAALTTAQMAGDTFFPSVLGTIGAVSGWSFTALLAVQTKRVRFLFDQEAFELRTKGEGVRENVVVGGANRWDYSSFVNYDFFPSQDLAVLIYFKETQTPEEMWNAGPGALDKRGDGQLHFFPAICDVKQIAEQFELRGCAKVED